MTQAMKPKPVERAKREGCLVRMPFLQASAPMFENGLMCIIELERAALPMMSFKDDHNRDRYRVWLRMKKSLVARGRASG